MKSPFLNDRWFPILIGILIIGLLLRSPFLVALPTTLLVIFSIAHWWRNHALDGVSYRRRFHYRRAFPGEEFPVYLEFENEKLLPLSWLRISDPWPRAVGPVDEDILAPSHIPDEGYLTHVFSLRWYERTRREYFLRFRKRGAYSIGPSTLESGDLFGIYEIGKEYGSAEKLIVFPPLLNLAQLEYPPENPYGDQKSRRRLFEDPNRPMGVRDYHPEDEFRKIHWPATARTGTLQVKVFQPTSAQVMTICMNVATFPRYWEGVYPEMLEYILSVSASLVEQGISLGYRVGLLSNGCLSHSDQPFRIPAGRSPGQLAHLLEALAGVSPVTVAPFERLLMREIPKVPYGSTLVVVTALLPENLLETLLRLKRHERRLTLVYLGKEFVANLPGIWTYHFPFREEIQRESETSVDMPVAGKRNGKELSPAYALSD